MTWRIFAALILIPISFPSGANEPLAVSLSAAHPGQMQVGGDAVRAVMKMMVAGALKNSPDAAHPSLQGLNLENLTDAQRSQLAPIVTAEFERLKRDPSNIVRATRAPDGSIYLTDGHHRATATYLLQAAGLLPRDAQILVDLPEGADFRERDLAAFERYLAARAYLTPAIRHQLQEARISPHAALENLPPNLEALSKPDADLPIRSTIGLVFVECNQRIKAGKKSRGESGDLRPEERAISGEVFEDYLEFKLGDLIGCKAGSERGEGRYNSEAVMERTRRALFGDPKTLEYLHGLAGPNRPLAEKQIANTVGCYRELEAERARDHRPEPPVSGCEAAAFLKQVAGQITRSLDALRARVGVPCPGAPELMRKNLLK
jgi:hypothetical protein